MSVIESRTFKSGNSVAVRLPRELGFAADTAITIEKIGHSLRITPLADPVEEKRKLAELIDALRDIWKDAPPGDGRGEREPIDFPDRPGLY